MQDITNMGYYRIPEMSSAERYDLINTIKVANFAEMELEKANDFSLSREDVVGLTACVKRGVEARQKLIAGNVYRVIPIAEVYSGLGISLPDLIQEGTLGLIAGIEKTSRNTNIRMFNRIVDSSIRAAIVAVINDHTRMIKPISLDSPDFEDICDDYDIVDTIAGTMLRETVEEVLLTTGITDRERSVLRLRFGLADGRTRTLEEIGTIFGVSRTRIMQIEAKALRKLRHPSRSNRLRDFLN